MKKLIFLLIALTLVLFSCEFTMGGWNVEEEEVQPIDREISAELVLTPALEHGYWAYKRKNDTVFTLIPKYFKVSGTHTFFDKVDPNRSYIKTDTGTIMWRSEFPDDKMITNQCSLNLFNTKDNTSLSWYGWMTVRFPPESTIYLGFSQAYGGGKLQKVVKGNFSMNGIFQYAPMSFRSEGDLWFNP